MNVIFLILVIIVLTYIERRIFLHFKGEHIKGFYKGIETYNKLRIPVYGFYYRIYSFEAH